MFPLEVTDAPLEDLLDLGVVWNTDEADRRRSDASDLLAGRLDGDELADADLVLEAMSDDVVLGYSVEDLANVVAVIVAEGVEVEPDDFDEDGWPTHASVVPTWRGREHQLTRPMKMLATVMLKRDRMPRMRRRESRGRRVRTSRSSRGAPAPSTGGDDPPPDADDVARTVA